MFEEYYSICLIFFKTTYWTMSPKRTGAYQHKMSKLQKDVFKPLQLQRKKDVDKKFAWLTPTTLSRS
jgi:hypothetical protein